MRDVLMADSGIWPVLIFWAVFALIGRAAAANKKRAQQQQQPGTGDRAPGTGTVAQGGLFAELKRAMEELKRAEAEQRGQAEQRSQTEQRTIAPPAPVFDREEQQRQLARKYLEKKKQEAARKRAARAKPFAPLPDAADMSSEDGVVSLEGQDYDHEAEAIIQKRRAAAERRQREETSSEELSDQQLARRAARHDVAIGTQAEHDDWHRQLAASEGPASQRAPAGPLDRFKDGSLRSAVILGEILGGPAGGRQRDG